MKHKHLAAAILLTLALQTLFGVLDRAPDFDEGIYLNFARTIHQNYFPVAPHHPDEPFFRHPPLHYYIVSLSTAIFGDSLPGARAGVSILSIVLLLVFYRWVLSFAPRAAGWAVILLAVNPAFLFYAHSAYMEITVALFALLAIRELSGEESGRRYIRAGIFLGLAFVTKYYSVTLAAAIGLYFVYAYGLRFLSNGRWTVFAIAALVLGGWFGAGYLIDSASFVAQTRSWFDASSESVASWRSVNSVKYGLELAGVITPVVAALGLYGVMRRTGWTPAFMRQHHHGVAAVFVLCHVLYLAATPIKDIKYCVPILPLLCVYAVLALEPMRSRRWLPAVAVFVFLFTSTPAAWFPNPIDRSWQANIYVFSLQRDKEYRNYRLAGEFIRDTAERGAWVVSSERAAIVGYYARTSYRDLWWEKDGETLTERLSQAPYVVLNDNSPYFKGANKELAESYVRAHFDRVADFEGETINLSVWKHANKSLLD